MVIAFSTGPWELFLVALNTSDMLTDCFIDWFCSTSLLPGTTRYPRVISYLPCPHPGTTTKSHGPSVWRTETKLWVQDVPICIGVSLPLALPMDRVENCIYVY